MKIRITRTTPTYLRPQTSGVFVQWYVDDPPSSPLTFTLQRSRAPQGPFEEVAREIEGSHFFDQHQETSDASTLSHGFGALARTTYYRVVGGGVSSDVAVVGDALPRRAMLLRRKIQRDFSIALRVGSGIPFVFLARKHWGARCTACYDAITRSVNNARCLVCYGTGFTGGYAAPYGVLARKGVTNMNSDVSPQGVMEVNQLRITMLDYPQVEYQDVMVETRQDRRYFVQRVTRTELRGVPVHQELIVSELPRNSIEYQIPIPSGSIPTIS